MGKSSSKDVERPPKNISREVQAVVLPKQISTNTPCPGLGSSVQINTFGSAIYHLLCRQGIKTLGGEFTSTGAFGVKCYAHKIYIHSFVRNSEAGPWMQDAQCCARLRKAASFSIRQL